jgi:hypothetical protein
VTIRGVRMICSINSQVPGLQGVDLERVGGGDWQPSSLGCNPVHLIVYKVEPPVCAVPTA